LELLTEKHAVSMAEIVLISEFMNFSTLYMQLYCVVVPSTCVCCD
jgi:hypothetical protein